MTSSTTFSDKSILYVEDEIIVAIEFAQVLEEIGFGEVLVAHNLRAAENAVRDREVDFALLDVNLGNGERSAPIGLALAQAGTRVIFTSGYNKSELSDDLQRFEFLEKPIALRELRALFANISAPPGATSAAE